MTTGNALEPGVILAEPLHEVNGYCSHCRSISHFMVDKQLGYYKRCPTCGNTEYLHRRFLRFNRQSRQWQ
jgi:hypothetical protein